MKVEVMDRTEAVNHMAQIGAQMTAIQGECLASLSVSKKVVLEVAVRHAAL